MKLSIFVLSILMCPVIAIAHHSRAEFSQEILELEGELVSARWIQPHPQFTVNVTNDAGEVELWRIQGFGSTYTLARAGVSSDYFTPGERVRIAGQPSVRRDRVFLANNMLLENGNEIVLNAGAAPYFNEAAIGGRAHWDAKDEDLVDAAAENRGLFRIWSQPNRNEDTISLEGGALSLHLPWNETAIAKQANWDPLDDPDLQCIPKGMPVVMATPHPFTFSREGVNIRILAHEYAVERIIHMEDIGNTDYLPTTPVGYSVGHWEGDTLVVETSQIDKSNYFFFGFCLGDSVEVMERMTLSEDQRRLDYTAVITDPETFSEPAKVERYWVALGEEPELFECEVEG
jgi:hypothetical protein